MSEAQRAALALITGALLTLVGCGGGTGTQSSQHQSPLPAAQVQQAVSSIFQACIKHSFDSTADIAPASEATDTLVRFSREYSLDAQLGATELKARTLRQALAGARNTLRTNSCSPQDASRLDAVLSETPPQQAATQGTSPPPSAVTATATTPTTPVPQHTASEVARAEHCAANPLASECAEEGLSAAHIQAEAEKCGAGVTSNNCDFGSGVVSAFRSARAQTGKPPTRLVVRTNSLACASRGHGIWRCKSVGHPVWVEFHA